ncbi:alpha-ketoglutarate-dependent dioxygenase AlkB family protein [Prochlorococcus sp. MIT 1307]|uniref:alpha-ketoglutarate-dependent dioxygenase AlkB family protein n=1 Tax=Prochlorococcus sp. MIT 1307 TaxID=3096219 RepID=UPI002A764D38|nr:alpha-ketoglutarate-dependent dioxygenase AlkB [Prochlorococcus sp. MIT 1307]
MEDLSEKRPWILIPSWMNIKDSEYWKNQINKNLVWEQTVVRVYGSLHVAPRMTNFLSEKHISYCYSGTKHFGDGWPDWFFPLLESVNFASKVKFNGCLLNLYRNGNDRMGWHSDDEAELDLTKPISSLSLGATRDFFLKHRSKNIKEVITLRRGDLLIMHPNCQKEWLHSIPTRKKVINQRINLTFRCYNHNNTG